MASTPTRIVLVRHGESNVTVEQIVGGHNSCTGLSPLGRRQAEALRDRLTRTGELGDASWLYASVLPRAVETAEIVRPAVGDGDLAVVQHCDLCEVHTGDEVDGLTWDELRERYGSPDGRARRDPYRAWAPGAESWAEFALRSGRMLRRLADEHEGETVVVACHGGVVETSFIAFGGQALDRPFETFVTNTSLTEWSRRADRDRWTLVRYNDAAHLAGVEHG